MEGFSFINGSVSCLCNIETEKNGMLSTLFKQYSVIEAPEVSQVSEVNNYGS